MGTLSPEERAAQRRTIATVRASGHLGGGGLSLWREADAGEWKASAEEIGADLALLEVPHETVTADRPPLAKSRTGAPRRGREVRVTAADLPHLVRWMPSLRAAVDEVPDGAPGFEFLYLEPAPGGMRVVSAPFSASWPAWTEEQAAVMGLLCARCSRDLRRGQEEEHAEPAYDVPAADRPRHRRLLCGPCCGDGVEELHRLAVEAR